MTETRHDRGADDAVRPDGLRVIGAGFGRTGTTSLRQALLVLGYRPCYHMQTALIRPSHMRFWIRAKSGGPVDLAKFLRRYRAAVDWPVCEFYRDLMVAFPRAKVVLTLRDPDEWYDSVRETLWAVGPALPRLPTPRDLEPYIGQRGRVSEVLNASALKPADGQEAARRVEEPLAWWRHQGLP